MNGKTDSAAMEEEELVGDIDVCVQCKMGQDGPLKPLLAPISCVGDAHREASQQHCLG